MASRTRRLQVKSACFYFCLEDYPELRDQVFKYSCSSYSVSPLSKLFVSPLSIPGCALFSSSVFIYLRLCGPGCVLEDEAYIPTYLEAFPPLPEKGSPGEKAGEPASVWGSKIRPIKASVITQVSPDYVLHSFFSSFDIFLTIIT